MPRSTGKNNIDRILDANINRAKEGLRVCEEVTRFILESRSLTASLKNIRHKVSSLAKRLSPQAKLFSGRDSAKDTGRLVYAAELKRKDICDIFLANIQRVKESVRVLEEFSKLINIKAAVSFKNIRYEVYELEKKIAQKIC
ncbi:MAG: thiamine-phosphate pyrophosphorylase [Candidatus Omnitrophota bacterium]